MEAVYLHEDIPVPLDDNGSDSIKALRDVEEALLMKTRRDASVQHEPGTIQKAVLMLITRILLDCGLENVVLFLKAIQAIVYEVLCLVSRSADPLVTLEEMKSYFHPGNKLCPLAVNRTTVSNMIPHADRSQLDDLLGNQAMECKTELKDAGASVDVMIQSIDGTHEKTHTKYRNNSQSHVVVGQQSTWETGFAYEGNFDSTSHIFMGIHHKDRKMSNKKCKGIRPWIERVSKKCRLARDAGFGTAVVAGDRGYFVAEFFAAASLGMLDPGAPKGQEPRVIVPVKFTREKNSFKWNFLVDDDSKQVFTREILLNPYNFPALKNKCKGVFERTNNGGFKIPYACVAMVDEYNAQMDRSLDEVKSRARTVAGRLRALAKERDEAVEVYLNHYKTVHKKEGKDPTRGKGRSRRVFKDREDEVLYKECMAKKDQLGRWKEEKAALLRSIMFFAISLNPGEDPSADPSKFIAFARDYHERWGIEIGYKDVKHRFVGEHRTRKPVIRSFHLVVGMMLYNRWQASRGKAAVTILGSRAMPCGPPDTSRPHVRRKIERECKCLPTAVGFLVDCWREALLSVVKKNIGKEK